MAKLITKTKTKSTSQPKSKNIGETEIAIDRRRAVDRREHQANSKGNQKSEMGKSNSQDTEMSLSDAAKPVIATGNSIADEPRTFQPARRKQQRRRQIDPTTCEREYNQPEIEFMQAIDAYKRAAGRMFPTCSEILEVIKSLGYVQLTEEERAVLQSIQEVEAELAEATETAPEACS